MIVSRQDKFKIEDYHVSDDLEAILRKGYFRRILLLCGAFLICVLWIFYLVLCWIMGRHIDVKSVWTMWPLLLFVFSACFTHIILPPFRY